MDAPREVALQAFKLLRGDGGYAIDQYRTSRAFLLLGGLVIRRAREALSFFHPKGSNGKVAAVVEIAQGVVGLSEVAGEPRYILRSQSFRFILELVLIGFGSAYEGSTPPANLPAARRIREALAKT